MGFKDLLPREHALWGWVGVPLFGALCAEPGASTALAAASTFAGFGAWNAAGRWIRGSERSKVVVGPAVAVAALAAVGAVGTAAQPLVMAAGLGAAGLAAGGALAATRGHPRQDPRFEAAGIVALAGYAGVVGVGAGGSVESLLVVEAAVATWLLLGLWWINRNLAPLLPNRRLWRYGLGVAVASAVVAFGVSLAAGAVTAGLLPLLYVVRVWAQRPPSGAKDARRLGLVELAWGLGIAAAAVLVQ